MNADGSGLRRLTRNTVGDRNPVWSPDGRRIAFESNWQLNVMNADGSRQRRLTRNGGRNFTPAWSPDGQKIAFERRLGRKKYGPCNGCGRASTFEICVMNADGSGQQRLTTQGAQPGWSPDGQKIAFMSERDGNAEIYNMNADGSQQRNLTRTPGGKKAGLSGRPRRNRERQRPTSPAPSERSRRPRGARGPCRGAVRGGAAARTPPPADLRGVRGARGAGRGRGVGRSPALDTAGHLFVGVRGAVGPSRRNDRFQARLHQPQELRLLWPRRPLPALRDERRWEREAAADPPCVGSTCLVARWAEDRLRRRHPRREERDLRHQCRWQRASGD